MCNDSGQFCVWNTDRQRPTAYMTHFRRDLNVFEQSFDMHVERETALMIS